MDSENEFKVTLSRSFGSEQVAFTATLKKSDHLADQIMEVLTAYDTAMYKAFTLTHARTEQETAYIKSKLTPEQLAALEKAPYLPKRKGR